jgi:hypothetical protein
MLACRGTERAGCGACTWAHFVPLDGHASPPAVPASSSVSISAPGRWESKAADGWMLHLRTVIMATTRDVLPTPLHVPPTTNVFGPLRSGPMFFSSHRSHTNCCVTSTASWHRSDTSQGQTASLIFTHHQQSVETLACCLATASVSSLQALTYAPNLARLPVRVWPPCARLSQCPAPPGTGGR